jgi:hypothetical protein
VPPRGAGPVIAGTIHASRIRVAGSRFQHWLDGKLVADGNLKSEAIRSVLRSNMEAGVKRFEAATEPRDRYNGLLERVTAQSLLIFDTDQSPIDFQHHYSGICFRNIKVRRLNRGAPADASEGSGGRSVVQFIVDHVRSRSSPVAIRIQSSL